MAATPQMLLKWSVISMGTVAPLVLAYKHRYSEVTNFREMLYVLLFQINGLKEVEVPTESYWPLSKLYGQVRIFSLQFKKMDYIY